MGATPRRGAASGQRKGGAKHEHILCVLRCMSGFGWQRIHRLRPTLVGGCRPLEMLALLSEAEWQIHHAAVVAPFGLASEIVIAEPR